MGQLAPLLAGKFVAFDTGPLIYDIEEHPDYLSPADELFSALDSSVAHEAISLTRSLQFGDPKFNCRSKTVETASF